MQLMGLRTVGGQRAKQYFGEFGSLARFFVLEIYEDITAAGGLGPDQAGPAFQIKRRVTLVPQAEVGVVGRQLERGGELLAVGDAQGDVPGPEAFEDLRFHPGGMAELKG